MLSSLRWVLVGLCTLALLAGCGERPIVDEPLDAGPDTTADTGVPGDTVAPSDSPDGAGDARDAAMDTPQNNCPSAVVRTLSLPMDTATGTLRGMSRNPSVGCARSTPGPEDYYLLRVATRTAVVVSTTSLVDTVLSLRRSCADPLTEVACNDDATPGARNASLRALLEPGDYFLIVDQVGGADGGATDGGPYTLSVTSGMFADNAACGSATLLSDGASVTGQDLSMASQTQTGCFPFVTGPMLFYRAMVPAGETLTVTVTPAMGSPMFIPAVRFLPTCGSVRCIAQGVGSATGTITAWTNFSDASQPVVVAVSGAMGASAGRYDLLATLGRGSRNATCSRATAATDGATFRGQSFGDATDVLPPCMGSPIAVAAGPALYYRATVPPGQALTVTVTPNTTTLAPVTRIMAACGELTCLSESGRPTTSGGHGARWLNAGAAPREVVVAVQAYPPTSTTVTFDVGFLLRPPPTNAVCARAQALSDTAPVMGANTLDGVEMLAACGDTFTGGPVLYYQVSVPPSRMLVATAMRLAGGSDHMLRLYPSCGGMCAATSGRAFTTSPAVVRYPNTGTTPQTVFLALSTATAGQTVVADLSVQFRPVAANASCAGAMSLADGAVARMQDTNGATDQRGVCTGTASMSGPQLYYRVALPPNQILTPTLTPTSGTGPWVVRMYPSCEATTCLATSTRTSGSTPATGRYVNGPTAQTILLAAGADTVGAVGTFDLGVTIRPAPAYNLCAMARSVRSGETVVGENSLDGREAPPPCPSLTSVSGALFYRIDVPAGNTLVTTLRRGPGSSWTPIVRVLPSCGATCRDAVLARPASDTAVSIYRNAGGATESVIVAVNSTSASIGGLYDIDFRLLPAPSNTTCAAAAAVRHGASLRALPVGEAPLFSAACPGAPPSRSLFYRATIPPGATLTAFASQPAGATAFVPTVQVLSGCAATTCLSGGISLGGGVVARHLNSSSAPLDAVIAVGAPSGITPSLVDLQVFIERTPYTITMAPAACEDLRAAAVVPEVTAGASPLRALPFPFRFFSEEVTHWSASYPGFAQLWPSGSGAGTTLTSNLALPSPSAPLRLVAPHWDSLSARTGTFRFVEATAPARHLTLEWADVTGVGSTLSFQVKLFETSHVVEFHYCRLEPVGSPLSTGFSATIGLQDGTGLRAAQHAFNMTSAVSTSSALRFTPTVAP